MTPHPWRRRHGRSNIHPNHPVHPAHGPIADTRHGASAPIEVSVTSLHITATEHLPPIHKDPFDRLLVARYPAPIRSVLPASRDHSVVRLALGHRPYDPPCRFLSDAVYRGQLVLVGGHGGAHAAEPGKQPPGLLRTDAGQPLQQVVLAGYLAPRAVPAPRQRPRCHGTSLRRRVEQDARGLPRRARAQHGQADEQRERDQGSLDRLGTHAAGPQVTGGSFEHQGGPQIAHTREAQCLSEQPPRLDREHEIGKRLALEEKAIVDEIVPGLEARDLYRYALHVLQHTEYCAAAFTVIDDDANNGVPHGPPLFSCIPGEATTQCLARSSLTILARHEYAQAVVTAKAQRQRSRDRFGKDQPHELAACVRLSQSPAGVAEAAEMDRPASTAIGAGLARLQDFHFRSRQDALAALPGDLLGDVGLHVAVPEMVIEGRQQHIESTDEPIR